MAKGWLDNYGTKANENNSSVSLPEGFVGMGNNTKGRNYSPAWGGQFQMGGVLSGTDLNLTENIFGNKNQYETYGDDSASNLNTFNPHYTRTKDSVDYGMNNYDDEYMPWHDVQVIEDEDTRTNQEIFSNYYTNNGFNFNDYNSVNEDGIRRMMPNPEDLYNGKNKQKVKTVESEAPPPRAIITGRGNPHNTFANPNTPNYQMGGNIYPVNYVPEAQMGASIPGAVGFSYARTQSPAPSNGKYAKKTMASAQEGLNLGPIIKDNSYKIKTVNSDPVKQWTLDYINSPKYKERLTKSGYENVPKEIRIRSGNVKNTKIEPIPNEAYEMNKMWDSGDFDKYSSHYNLDENIIHLNEKNDALLYKDIYKNSKFALPTINETESHELGHAEVQRLDPTGENDFDFRLNKKDVDNLIKRSGKSKGINKHDQDPYENKADLNSFRYNLKQQGIYDAGKEDFNEEHLKKAKKTFAKDRLLKNYSDKDLIWLMNNIAQNEQSDEDINIAQNGQEMKYYQEGLDFKPKSISKNGGWLSKYDVAQAGAQVEYGTPEYEEAYNKGEVVTDEGGRSPILLDEVVVKAKPLTEFGKTRKEIAEKNKWEDYAQKYLGNFEKNMGQTLENLPESRKQEYEDYINKLAFDEYVKTHPQVKGEERGAYIDRMQAENANSSNFERAYEANADYNDATDVNKWRKGLIGLGSLVLPKPAMDYMKQESDYFSKKEKQAMIDNPISTQVGDVLGTLEPLTVPVESLYGDKSFGDIASGQSANIPMTARILGDPLMLGFEAAPLIGSGFRTAGRLLGTEEGLLSNAWKLNPRAYQYNLPENTMWRGLGKTGLDDALENEVLRTANKTGNYGEDLYITTDFNTAKGNYSIDQPTYKGDPFSEIDDWEQILPKDTKSYIAEIPESALTNKNIVNNSSIVINKGSIPTNDVRLLKQDWWQGYKPIEVPTSSLENSYPSFKQITNAPENINAEHLAGLIKREADWLRSPEYLKRKMNATGRSEASIKKESEEIINHINNTSIDYTGTNESNVVGLYSSGKNPKIRVFDGIPEYPYSDHPFYTGTLDHEVKHAFSESAYTSDKALDFIQNTGYKNYPKANLNKTFGDRVKSAFDKNWANLSAEQQVTGRRMMDVIEKDQGIKRGTELTDANIDQLVESLKLNRYVDDDIYHVATQFKRKFGDDYKKHLKDFLNKAWMSVPAVIGLDAASETDKKKDGGIIKDDMGYWNPDNWGSPVEIGSTDITMEGVYEPLLGISDTGDTKLMKPGKNYKFKGKKVTEFPMAKNGLRQEQKGLVNLDQLTNFTNYNKPQPGGWLNKYN
jgi:hypothetical protein